MVDVGCIEMFIALLLTVDSIEELLSLLDDAAVGEGMLVKLGLLLRRVCVVLPGLGEGREALLNGVCCKNVVEGSKDIGFVITSIKLLLPVFSVGGWLELAVLLSPDGIAVENVFVDRA